MTKLRLLLLATTALSVAQVVSLPSHAEQPRLVIDAIRQVVDAVRSGSHQVAGNETDTELLPITESSRIPLEKALDEAFTISGLHH